MCNTNNVFSGKDIYLIGGGNSFDPTITSKLPTKQVVCINSTYIFFREFLALFWMDHSWYQKNSHKIHKLKTKLYNISTYNQFSTKCGINWIKLYSQDYKKYSTNLENNSVIGNNTGAAVIDYLDKNKANNIYLLGFDCKRVNGKSHSHNEYRFKVNEKNYNSVFIPCFEALNKNLQHAKVYNCSNDSALTFFPYKNLNQAIAEGSKK